MSAQGAHILVVDDERAIRHFLRVSLSAQGYVVAEAATGHEALEVVAVQPPDVLILDLGLPDMEGIEVARRLREWTELPIIILSVREKEQDKIAALDAGADDYLTKPFSVGELSARVRAALRRTSSPPNQSVYTVGSLVLDLARRVVTREGAGVHLTPTEYDLLRVLIHHHDRVLTHTQLLERVWGAGYEEEVHLLRVNISNLRRKLEQEPTRPVYLLTEPGVGYRFKSGE
ncbi:MAG: response regulator [Ardenticatenales bacterium]|nr:response regulator [Ardenticatenales bacterium]